MGSLLLYISTIIIQNPLGVLKVNRLLLGLWLILISYYRIHILLQIIIILKELTQGLMRKRRILLELKYQYFEEDLIQNIFLKV